MSNTNTNKAMLNINENNTRKIPVFVHPLFTIYATVGTIRLQCSNGLVVPEKKRNKTRGK